MIVPFVRFEMGFGVLNCKLFFTWTMIGESVGRERYLGGDLADQRGGLLTGEFRRGGGGLCLGMRTGAAVISCPSIWPVQNINKI